MAKYGPSPYQEEERRLAILLSVSNKNTSRLKRFREAVEAKEGHTPSREELIELIKTLSYRAIDAYCEGVERDTGAIIL